MPAHTSLTPAFLLDPWSGLARQILKVLRFPGDATRRLRTIVSLLLLLRSRSFLSFISHTSLPFSSHLVLYPETPYPDSLFQFCGWPVQVGTTRVSMSLTLMPTFPGFSPLWLLFTHWFLLLSSFHFRASRYSAHSTAARLPTKCDAWFSSKRASYRTSRLSVC